MYADAQITDLSIDSGGTDAQPNNTKAQYYR